MKYNINNVINEMVSNIEDNVSMHQKRLYVKQLLANKLFPNNTEKSKNVSMYRLMNDKTEAFKLDWLVLISELMNTSIDETLYILEK